MAKTSPSPHLPGGPPSFPRLRCIENHLDGLLSYLDYPEAHQKKVHTTNAIERAFWEVCCRTRPMNGFQNLAS